jgi:peptidoglycan/LPS O-acetylase OafA/YrhL
MTHIEGLRGLAMSLVFLGHFQVLFGHYLAPASASKAIFDFAAVWGHRGVAFFLVITGYFIYRHCLERPAERQSFVRKRLLRVLPLYWFVLCLYLGLSALFPAESKLPHNPTSALIVILQNVLLIDEFVGAPSIMVVSWTISYLVVVYLSVPLAMSALRMRQWRRWQRVMLVLAVAGGWMAACRWNSHLSIRVVIMTVGMLVYESLAARASGGKKLSRRGEVVSIGLLILSMCLWYLADKHFLDFLPGKRFLLEYRYLFLAVGLYYFFSYVLAYRGHLQRFLSGRPFRYLGQRSYSYYLIHGVTMKAVVLAASRLFHGIQYSPAVFWLLLPVSYLATLASATCLHVFVEEPMARWLSQRPGRAAAVTGRPLLSPLIETTIPSRSWL